MSQTFLLNDVMLGKYDNGVDANKIWKFVEDKKICEYKMNDIKHWIYQPCWSINDDCYLSIYQVLLQKLIQNIH